MNKDIWISIRSGKPDAYNALYKEYAVMMFGYGMKLAANVEVVEEAIQCVFVNLYRQHNTLSLPISIKAYLLGALKNEIYRCHNRMKRFASWEANVKISDIGLDYDFQLELDTESMIVASEAEQEKYADLQKALDALPARQREAVYLKYYNNLSGEEVAQIMEISHQTVRTTLMNALINLRKEMMVPIESIVMMLIFLS